MSVSSHLQDPAWSGSSSEDALIQQVLSGQPEKFYELIKPYERRVYLTAYAILQNHADAEDAAQEGILKAFRSLSTFRGEARFSTWLLRITVNEARMRIRARRDHVSISDERDDASGYTPLLLRDWREIASDVLERKEVREQIAKGLDSLTQEYREIFVLRDIQGLNIAETASVLGISSNIVKIRLLRARLRLRDFLAPLLRKVPPSRAGNKGVNP